MPSFFSRLLAVAVLPCCLQLYAGSLSAAPLDAALDESERLSAEAKASQARIDQLDDATREMLNEYRSALQQTEALKAYNKQLQADLPFLPDERADRLAGLQDLLPRADVSLAEKYRRILEAYQIESDYGRTLEAWRGELPGDAESRSVEFLRLGRVMLYYQTLDAHESGWWNPQTRAWEVLDGSARRPLTQAIAIARQQQAPAYLQLPVKTLAEEAAQ